MLFLQHAAPCAFNRHPRLIYPATFLYSSRKEAEQQDVDENNDPKKSGASEKVRGSFHDTKPRGCHSSNAPTAVYSAPVHVAEEKHHYEMTIDLPGVKTQDVEISVDNGNLLQIRATRRAPNRSYACQFSLNESSMDIANITASLADGVLTLTVPKRDEPIFEIPVSATEPSSLDGYFSWSIDVPGIKLADLQVHLNKDEIHVRGVRGVGDKKTSLERVYAINEKLANAKSACAFLIDGVLTLAVPREEKVSVGKVEIPLKQPAASSSVEIETTDKTTNQDQDTVDNMNKRVNEEIMVETADENDGDDEEGNVGWEDLGTNGKKGNEHP